jgi:hypothetical protein
LVNVLQLIELYYFRLLQILEIMIFGYTYILFVFPGWSTGEAKLDRQWSIKGVVQAKLTTIYGKSSLRTSNGSKSFFNLINNNSEDCIIIGRPQSHGIQTKGPGVSFVFKVEGERRACGNTSPTKHAHMENTTPRVYVKSPSCKE